MALREKMSRYSNFLNWVSGWTDKSTKQREDLLEEFETSAGTLLLMPQEADLLNKLKSGLAEWQEGQALYSMLSSRNIAFPIEWERMVLALTLSAHPDRLDLLERLAVVEEQIATQDDPVRRAIDFERLRLRVQTASLINPDQTHVSAEQRLAIFSDAIAVLSSNEFHRQKTERRCEIIKSIHDTFMAVPATDLYLIAEIGLHAFEQMLKTAKPTLAEACMIHDCLHALFFSGVSDVRDLRRFDHITPLFEDWLKRRGHCHSQPLPLENGQITIAYLLHTAHFDRGNAVSRLIASLAEMHGQQADRRVLLYVVQFVSQDFVDEMVKRGVEVRSFPEDMQYNRLDEIEAALRADKVDVVITEQNRAIAAALFVRRVTRCQIWLDTGFPFWSLQSLDWTLSPPLWGLTELPPRTSGIAWRQRFDTLRQEVNQIDELHRLRASFPKGSFVLGVFVRLIKLDQTYLDFLTRLLLADSRFHLVVAGPGDPSQVQTFAQQPQIASRVTLQPGMVDLNLYGQVIDVMCDTFPFIGGNACREVSVYGTPIIAKLGTPWDGLLKSDRNPDLLAETEDEYIALAKRLADDSEFMAKQRSLSLEKAAEYCYPDEMIKDVEAAITGALTHDKNKRTIP